MTKEFSVTLEPSGRIIRVGPQTTVMQAIRHPDLAIRSDCGGTGLCGKCSVVAGPAGSLSALTITEQDSLSPLQQGQGFRLACQVEIIGDVTVRIPESAINSVAAGGKALTHVASSIAPPVRRVVLQQNVGLTAEPGTGDLLANLLQHTGNDAGQALWIEEIEALRQLSRLPPESRTKTLVVHEQKGVTAILDGAQATSLGLGVDIGTTTIAAYLCDLADGVVLASLAASNPQGQYGEDVISRIAAVQNRPEALAELTKVLVATINRLITACLEKAGAVRQAIDEVVIVGNTTMQTFLAGMSPVSLGRSPYLPICRSSVNLRAVDVGFHLNPGTSVYIFPVISGFLGGDLVGAALGDGLHLHDQITLVIDIGTNGELVLGNNRRLLATSCATGPALEGANISCGMRATAGAISKVGINFLTMQPEYQVIGKEIGARPLGVCGSGLIDAMATLRRLGILRPSGRFNEAMAGVIRDPSGIGQAYVLVPGEKSGTGQPITITLKDVRSFQLAKSALAAGIEMLMRQLPVRRVDRTVLTGAFGAHFNWQNAAEVGMIPRRAVAGEVCSAANLAGVGAMQALLDKNKRLEAETLAARAECIELAIDPGFNELFIAGISFPGIGP